MLQLIDQMLVSGLQWEGFGSENRVRVSQEGERVAGFVKLGLRVIGKRGGFLPDWWVWDFVGLTSCDWLKK